MRPHHRFGLFAALRQQRSQGVEHVPVAQVPGFAGAAIHGAVVLLGGEHHAGVAFGVEEAVTVAFLIGQASIEQGAQLLDYRVVARGVAAHDVVAVDRRFVLPGTEAAVASPRRARGLRVNAIQIGQYRLDRGAEAVDVQSAKFHLPRRRLRGVMVAQPVDELGDLPIAPHPGRKALEAFLDPVRRFLPAHMAVDPRRIRPVRFGRDDGKSVALHQPSGDRRPGSVELGRAMTGLADQYDAGIGEAIETIGKTFVVRRGQFHGMAPQLLNQLCIGQRGRA